MDAVLKNSSNGVTSSAKSSTFDKKADKKNFFQDYDNELSEYDLQLIRERLMRDGVGEM